MIRPNDILLSNNIRERLHSFDNDFNLEGIRLPGHLECLVNQIVDSIRRIKYVTTLRDKEISATCLNPNSIAFDPLKAAILHMRNGDPNEAFWLIFLLTHFGKNKRTNWRLLKDVYGNLGGPTWNWVRVVNNGQEMGEWINNNKNVLRTNGHFGNHRKYESLNQGNGTGRVILSYIDWIGNHQDHMTKMNTLIANGENTPRDWFSSIYASMNRVFRFGRTARFDYLTMIGKIGLLNIEPGSTFMEGATGPYSGGRLLFYGNANVDISREDLDILLIELERHLNLYYGMQVLEDALCNWQKNPTNYIHFIG